MFSTTFWKLSVIVSKYVFSVLLSPLLGLQFHIFWKCLKPHHWFLRFCLLFSNTFLFVLFVELGNFSQYIFKFNDSSAFSFCCSYFSAIGFSFCIFRTSFYLLRFPIHFFHWFSFNSLYMFMIIALKFVKHNI